MIRICPLAITSCSARATFGQLPVQADNPYWTENGAVTVEDPDHWRVMLMPRPLA